MKRMKKIVITLFIMLALSACSKPIPADKFAYIGYWQGPGMYLEILPDGTFDYQRGGTSISSSVDEFDGDNFLVDMLIMNTTFEVSQPPFFSDGQWSMVVDGVRLTRTDD
ncbi:MULTISPECIES: membrane lipoprotein lipid attachment site-containing protein [unclassified Pseudoalteromonas]|nr:MULTISPECIES: membrane lipoprotein lipid attachment site-containing protein [unclassified Pseudoalteromonas]